MNPIKDEPETLEEKEESAEEILETCVESITDFPPKKEYIERSMKKLTSSQKRKAEHKKKKNMTTEKIKKSVRFVRF